jgi:hypothetical protein
MFMRPAPGQLAAKMRELKELREHQGRAQRNGRRPIKQSVAAHRRWLIRRIKAFNEMQTSSILMAAHDRAMMTTDDAARFAADTFDRFNAVMKRRGLGIRIEFKTAASIKLSQLWDGAGMEALRILTGPELYEKGPDGWCGPLLEGLWLCMLNPMPDEAAHREQSKREWDRRLRQTKKGKAFRDAETTQQLKEQVEASNRADFRKDIERKQRALDRLAPDSEIVPVGWPYRWTKAGYIPVRVPKGGRGSRQGSAKPTMSKIEKGNAADGKRFRNDMKASKRGK